MKNLAIICLILALATGCRTQMLSIAAVDVTDLLAAAEEAKLPEYRNLRDRIVSMNTAVLPELERIQTNASTPWQRKLMCGICIERIGRGREISELIRTDWTKDPEYHVELQKEQAKITWNGQPMLGGLKTRRYREKGLWFYYLELVWKETEDRPITPGEDPGQFRFRICRTLLGSPCEDLLVHVLTAQVQSNALRQEHRLDAFVLKNMNDRSGYRKLRDY
jgi:hypothetical protein